MLHCFHKLFLVAFHRFGNLRNTNANMIMKMVYIALVLMNTISK